MYINVRDISIKRRKRNNKVCNRYKTQVKIKWPISKEEGKKICLP